MKPGQEPGKYGLECLQNLFVSAGGDITNGKLVVENGGLNQLNTMGDIDTIGEYLSNLYTVATTGKNSEGNKVGANAKEHASIINDSAQKMFGYDIATPCEDITEDDMGNIVLVPKTGAVEADCLDWLWMNTGTDQSRYSGDQGRRIPNTYISINDRFSGLSSVEGTPEMRDRHPFQTCQRTGAMAPLAKDGTPNQKAIRVANTKGGVKQIQDFYNNIFQQANNPASSARAADQEQSMVDCYGIKKSATKAGDPNYLGCFKDCQQGRALPNRRNDVSGSHEQKKLQCETMAKQAGENLYGLQFEHECWTGKDVAYDRMGAAQNCPANGGGCTQQVYRVP
jgi:hypothetical protein